MGPKLPRRAREHESDSESDSETLSRPSTPASTALNDRKRARRSTLRDEVDSSGSESSSLDLARTNMGSAGKKSAVLYREPAVLSKHQAGAIVRVKLTNFVTYTLAEFYPGPNLNMVIGPNGTGKSTLVCAICLGLGWGTSYLGRGKDVAEFVKHGCREATIEIELQRRTSGEKATRRNPIISRTIKRDGNKSSYTLNGNATTGKAVQSLAQGFNIQIDNLCQFLPQDKVVEFASMNPIEILQSTQRAAASHAMIEMHEALKRLRQDQQELMGDNRGDREQLENLENRQEMQRTEVDRMRERVTIQKRLEGLELCRPIAQYLDARKSSEIAKSREKQISAELKNLERESGPTLRRVNAKQTYEQQLRALKQQRESDVASAEQTCTDTLKEVEALQTRLDEFGTNYAAEKRSIQPKREEIRRLQQNIARLKYQKTQKPEDFDAPAMNREMQEVQNRIRELEERNAQIKEKRDELVRQIHDRNKEMKDVTQRLSNLETQSGQQENRLEQRSRDTFKAWKWIQDNKDQFEQEIFGPPLVECSLKDVTMANAVESLLQESDYRIITVQNERDFALLQRKLNHDLNLHEISLRTCSLPNLDQFQSPLTQEQMRECGLASWAIDHLNGPPTVLAMLCIEKGLHQCGIASREVSQEQHRRLQDSTVRSYVVGNQCHQFVRRSEYGAAGNLARVRFLKDAEFWTNQPIDMGRKATLERRIAELKGEGSLVKEDVAKCDVERKENDNESDTLRQQKETIKTEKEAKQKALVAWNALDVKIKQEEENEQRVQDYLLGIRGRLAELVAEKDVTLLEQSRTVLRYAAAIGDVNDRIANLLESEVLHIEAKSDFEVLKSRNQHIVETIEQRKQERKEAEDNAKAAVTRAKDLYKSCTELRTKSLVLEENGDRTLSELLRELGEKRHTVDEFEAEIDSHKAQLELTEGGNVNAIREFEEREKSIQKLRVRLTEFNKRQSDLTHAITEVRQKWEPELDELVSKINHAFSDSFERIGCAGQVTVHKASSTLPTDCAEENGGPENELDFGNWAIHILVKFRDNEELSLLDSHRQSGGERAVSTIFYLMALQSLSRAPFRVVDEINQGMDPRNERMVHGRMVDIAADDGGSQYFLITPKLLSGLKYRRGMTVLCIASGENMPAAKTERDGNIVDNPRVDFRAFAKKAQELGLSKMEVGKQTDLRLGFDGALSSMAERGDGIQRGLVSEVSA